MRGEERRGEEINKDSNREKEKEKLYHGERIVAVKSTAENRDTTLTIQGGNTLLLSVGEPLGSVWILAPRILRNRWTYWRTHKTETHLK